MSDEKPMGQVIQIDEARIRDHLGEMVRGTVEETLNAMLDAEADRLSPLSARLQKKKPRLITSAPACSLSTKVQSSQAIVGSMRPELGRVVQ